MNFLKVRRKKNFIQILETKKHILEKKKPKNYNHSRSYQITTCHCQQQINHFFLKKKIKNLKTNLICSIFF